MTTRTRMLVATFTRANFLLVDRATRNLGIVVSQVEPTLDAMSASVPTDSSTVVVVDALQNERKALDFCKSLKSRFPELRILFLGGSTDIATVARAIAVGVSDFFLPHTPIDELMTLFSDAVAHRSPSDASLFGRVRSRLPVSRTPDGGYLMYDGSVVTDSDAVMKYGTAGLTVDEIACALGLAQEQVAALLASPRSKQNESLSDRLKEILGVGCTPRQTDYQSDRASAESPLTPLLSVLGVMVVVAIAWRLFFMGSRATPQDRFVPLQGVVQYEDGSPLTAHATLMFGVQSDGAVAPPLYSGVATVDHDTGVFSTSLRVPSEEPPPHAFSVAILDRSLIPLAPDVVPLPCSDLLTTPLTVDATVTHVTVRIPKPQREMKERAEEMPAK